MSRDSNGRDRRTRRAYIGASGALLGGAFLAGCTGDGAAPGNTDASTDTDGNTDGTNPTETPTASETTAETATTDGTSTDEESYTVSMSPMGEVAFEKVPEDLFTVFTQYADMAVALGRGADVNAVYVPAMSGTTMNQYYARLDGVAFEWEGLVDPLSDGLPKEQLYALDSDVHFADPAWASTQNNWDEGDVEEVTREIGPWFGNFYSGTNAPGPAGYEAYEHYTLWDIFGKVAAVLQERERYEALAAVHADLVETIRSNLPPEEERPTAVRATLASDGSTFYSYHLNEPGFWLADTRPLGAVDAFATEDWGELWGTVDFETMLEADPDVFLHLWGFTPNYSMAETRRALENHDVGSQLTAVRNDRVHAAGMRYQGPLMNLFQLEMGAKQLYPDVFGEWPRYVDGDPYPEIPEAEWLFDRERVAAIVNGTS